jgi:glycosyltransferase involved in cell wall biosynthesis
MMVSCILTSYNRPVFLRQALKSVEQQTWKNYELILMDESDPDVLDAMKVVNEFSFPLVRTHVSSVSPEERATTNQLGRSINLALSRAAGDLICYLADDDYYFPDWFEEGVKFFKQWPTVLQAFGALHYSGCREMRFDQTNGIRFFDKPVTDPFGVLDHSMVMHRRRNSPVLWPTWPGTQKEPDAFFFRELAKSGPFHPILSAAACVKRLHPKNLQRCIGNSLEGVRE